MGSALDVRGIQSAGNLVADVAGDIESVDGVLKITRIHLNYTFRIPPDSREKVDRLLKSYADQCPAYQTVKDAVHCTWDAQIEEAETES